MKKLFKYEINESIAAQAAMNCLKNRNQYKMLKEAKQPKQRVDKYEVAADVVQQYMNEIPEEEKNDPAWFFGQKIQEKLGIQFLGMPKKELKAWWQAINDVIELLIKPSVTEEHPEDYNNSQSQLADAWD